MNEDDTVLLPVLKTPARVVSIPETRRVLTDRVLQSVAVMRACWVNGIDLPAPSHDYRGAGKQLAWDEPPVPGEMADEASIGG